MSRERRLSAKGSRRAPQRRGTPGVFPVSLSKCPMVWVMDRQPSPTQRIRALPGGAPGQPLKTPDGVVMDRRFPATQGTPGVFPVGPSKCPMVWVMDRQPSPSLRAGTLEMIYAITYTQKNVAFRAVENFKRPTVLLWA
jgi:hypothetical protein